MRTMKALLCARVQTAQDSAGSSTAELWPWPGNQELSFAGSGGQKPLLGPSFILQPLAFLCCLFTFRVN